MSVGLHVESFVPAVVKHPVQIVCQLDAFLSSLTLIPGSHSSEQAYGMSGYYSEVRGVRLPR